MKNIRTKAVAVLAGVAVAGIVGAAAATLGGLNAESLGADTGVITSCDTDGIDVGYTTSAAAGGYTVQAVTFSGVADDCAGLDWSAQLLDGSGVELASGSGTAAAGSFTWTLTTPASAELVEGVALVISG